eukprot:486086-Amphidinium_carterae.1
MLQRAYESTCGIFKVSTFTACPGTSQESPNNYCWNQTKNYVLKFQTYTGPRDNQPNATTVVCVQRGRARLTNRAAVAL